MGYNEDHKKKRAAEMKILIAENDKDLRYALQVLFRKNHFTVDAVENGEDALEAKRERGFLDGYRYRVYQNESGTKI